MNTRKLGVGCLTALLAVFSFGAARAQRPMTLVDLLEVPSLSDAQVSPLGDGVVFVRSDADWKANKRIGHIWLAKIDGGEAFQLTNGTNGEESPIWSPDGQSIAFLAKRGDAETKQIFLIGSRGGEARRLSSHETEPDDVSWSADGTHIYFLAKDPKSEAEKKRDKQKNDVFAFDENYRQEHLWKISVETGATTRVTEGDFSVRSYQLSRDGRRIALHRAPSPLFDDSDEGEVWVMNVDGGGARQLTSNRVPERGASFSPDGSQVLFLADSNQDFDFYYNDNIFIAPADGGAVELKLPELPYEVQRASWSADGEALFFVANMGVRNELFRYSPGDGALRQLTDGQHSVQSWSYEPRAKLHVFELDQPRNAGDLWVLPGEGGSPKQVTRVFDYLAVEFELPRQERIEWKGADGATVEGLLFYPLNYEEGRRYPLVVQTHGGPASSDKFGFGRWSSYVPILAARGYAVLKPNYRGSTGYGDAFLRDMVGGYFRNAHLDVMAGVDYLIERGIADGDRMAKMGWSAGGHMTNKIITFTDRFKAASSGAGAVNWISMYGQSDVRIYRTPWFGGTPWQKDAPIETYWEHSPLKDVWKVRTPTLVLVGENDVRVPPPQSVELYRALKSNGVPTRLYIAPREPHGWRELRHGLFKMNVELDWFEKHVMGREYAWEKAPGDEAQMGPAAEPEG